MSTNPYESPRARTDSTNGGKGARPIHVTVASVMVAVVLVLFLAVLSLPATRTSREAARRNQCLNHLKQIALALHDYQLAHGALPPAYTVDPEGNRLHSWRTLILPYLEESQLYGMIDLSKPWNDPANAMARKAVVHTYWCPSATHEKGLTTYLAVVGNDCAFSGSAPRSLSNMTDGTDSLIVVIDVDVDRAVHWMSPHDIEADEVVECVTESFGQHPGIFNVAFADGHAAWVQANLDEDDLRGMLTTAGGEELGF